MKNVECRIKYKIEHFGLPDYESIPNVGLFLDQVTKYLSEYFKEFHSFSVTGSMISNYVKQGLVANPVRRQYGREQIAYLFFIVVAKTVLSLEDIQLLIQLQKQTYPVQAAYEYFRQELSRVLNAVFGVGELSGSGSGPDTPEREILRNTVIAVAHKVYIDQCLLLSRGEQTDQD